MKIDEDGLGFRVRCIIFENVALIHIDLVADADDARHAEVLRGGDIAHRVRGEVARLGDIGNGTPRGDRRPFLSGLQSMISAPAVLKGTGWGRMISLLFLTRRVVHPINPASKSRILSALTWQRGTIRE